MDVRKRGLIIFNSLSIAIFVGIGCGGGSQIANTHPQPEMQTSVKSDSDSSDPTIATSNGVSKRPYSYNNGKNKESDSIISKDQHKLPIVAISADSVSSAQSSKADLSSGHSSLSNHQKLIYYGNVISEDSSHAVDDYIWRQFDLAAEYHSMGVIANDGSLNVGPGMFQR